MIDCESCILKNALISDTGKCYVSCLDLEDALREHDKRIKAEAEKEHNKMCDTCIHKVSKEDIEQIRIDVIAEISREIRLLYGNEYEQQVRAEAIDDFFNACEDRNSFYIPMTIIMDIAEQLKEQK